MKVEQLIRLLEDEDPNAEVLLGHQPHWPFEYSIAGIATRKDAEETAKIDQWVEEHEEEFEGLDPVERMKKIDRMTEEMSYGSHFDGSEKNANDVILVEGSQMSYGSKEFWNTYRY